METQRDNAAYKQAYDGANSDRCYPDKIVVGFLRVWLEVGRSAGPEKYFGRIDGLTEILMERGLCSSVLNWHTRPARAADDLEW